MNFDPRLIEDCGDTFEQGYCEGGLDFIPNSTLTQRGIKRVLNLLAERAKTLPACRNKYNELRAVVLLVLGIVEEKQ